MIFNPFGVLWISGAANMIDGLPGCAGGLRWVGRNGGG